MSMNPPNPSGLDGGSGNFFQGDRNGEDPPQPPDKEINKNKNNFLKLILTHVENEVISDKIEILSI